MSLFIISKKKMVFAIFLFTIFTISSLFFIQDLSSHDLLICEFLFAVSSVLLLVKISQKRLWLHNCIMVALGIIFIVFIPQKMYFRTELLINDMLGLYDGTTALNVVIILMIISTLLLITQSTALAFGISGILCLIFSVINFYVNSFRGTPLSLSDILALRTAITVMGTYNYAISAELWKSFAYYFAFISLGFFIKIDTKNVRYHIAISAIAITIFSFSFVYYKLPSSWSTPGLDGNGTLWCGEAPFGEYVYFIRSFEASSMRKIANYSEKKLNEIKNDTIHNSVSSEITPNIIMIMNEAWSDLSVLGLIETTEPLMPFYESLKSSNRAITGYTLVNIQGGMTADTEFEALTGDSLAFLDISAVPYQMQVNHDLASLATILSAQGYETIAMHPNSGASWNRNSAYGYLGFDKTVFFDDYDTEMEYIGSYVSDSSNYKEIINQYEKRDLTKPFFLFNVTIQNHSAYWSQTDILLETTKVGNAILPSSTESDEFRDLNIYLNLMNISDKAISELIKYFENVSEPTIICMFGDHQPLLSDKFYDTIFEGSSLTGDEQKALQFSTPYFVWANYDTGMTDYGDISASYLSPVICEIAGLKRPTYYDYLLEFRKTVPYFNRYTMTTYDDSIFDDYRILMYNHLMEKDYRKDIFEINR